MKLQQELLSRTEDFLDLCRKHKVKSIYAFGSAITEKFNENDSDVDLLVEIEDDDPIERGEKLMSLWDKLEEFFQRKVDLLTDASIKNPILRRNIDQSKTLIYDGKSQKILV